jgi:hypothetical protein
MCITEVKEDDKTPLQLGVFLQNKQTKKNRKSTNSGAKEHIEDGEIIFTGFMNIL